MDTREAPLLVRHAGRPTSLPQQNALGRSLSKDEQWLVVVLRRRRNENSRTRKMDGKAAGRLIQVLCFYSVSLCGERCVYRTIPRDGVGCFVFYLIRVCVSRVGFCGDFNSDNVRHLSAECFESAECAKERDLCLGTCDPEKWERDFLVEMNTSLNCVRY